MNFSLSLSLSLSVSFSPALCRAEMVIGRTGETKDQSFFANSLNVMIMGGVAALCLVAIICVAAFLCTRNRNNNRNPNENKRYNLELMKECLI